MKSKKNVKKYRKKSTRNYGKKSQKKGGMNLMKQMKQVKVYYPPVYSTDSPVYSYNYSPQVDLRDEPETIFEVNYNLCAIYSNPIYFLKNEDCSGINTIGQHRQLRTPCQEIKNISLHSVGSHLIVPAATKEDIIDLLADKKNFNTDILFITSHGLNNKILCENEQGKCYIHRNEMFEFKICNEQLLSSDDFLNNLKSNNNLKLLFLNCCKMKDFAMSVSEKHPNISIICWTTDAEDVSCLDFQKKILLELKNPQNYDPQKYDDFKKVYTNAAKEFIKECGNIERIEDPSTFRNMDSLRTIRPTGLNCLIKNKLEVANLKSLIDNVEGPVVNGGVPELLPFDGLLHPPASAPAPPAPALAPPAAA